MNDAAALPRLGFRRDVVAGLAFFVASSTVVGFGVLLGGSFLRPPRSGDPPADIGDLSFRFDGQHYRRIAVTGYSYDPQAQSDVAFFPLYPLLVRGAAVATGLRVGGALFVVSNVMLAFTFVAFHRYVRLRCPAPDSPVPTATLAAFAFFPLTMFFHMAYSESTFLCVAALTLLAIQNRASVWTVATLAGLVSASRPVGVAFLPVVLLYLWRRAPTAASFAGRAGCVGALSCWGLLAYMAYQQVAFGDALAFAKTQEHWGGYTNRPLSEKLISLVTLEPIWAAYEPASARHWASSDHRYEPIYSLLFLNPIVFVGVGATVAVGARMRVLNAYEVLLSAGLLLIPYLTRAFENSMFSTGRFAAAVLPCYLVWGRMAGHLPQSVGIGCVGIGGYLLGAYAALFTAAYLFF